MKQRQPIETDNGLDPVTPKRPALRLVKTTTLTREDWLDVRRGGIGSSDAAAAVGLNPYCSQLELWMDKTGRGDLLPGIDPNDEESPTYWGTLLEPIVAAHYTKRTGYKVRRLNAVLQHPTHRFMRANIDREVMNAPDVQILECKTAGINGARLWRDGVPEYVQLQVQHQLAVTGKDAADVAVLLGGQHLEIHRIERDAVLIARLIELEAQFWQCVENDTPPPADGSESAGRALQALYPERAGEVMDLSDDTVLNGALTDWLATKTQLSQLGEVESALKQQIQQAMGSASTAIFGAGTVTWRTARDSQQIDCDRLAQEHPALVARYVMNRPGSRRFLFNATH